MTFVQRFGSALIANVHLHCCVTNGVFSLDPHGTLRFHAVAELDTATLSAVQRQIRIRVLRIAVRHGVLTADVAAEPARWVHGGGFSVHAGVLIDAADRSAMIGRATARDLTTARAR